MNTLMGHIIAGLILVAAVMPSQASADPISPAMLTLSGARDGELIWSLDDLVLTTNNWITSKVSLDENAHVLDQVLGTDNAVLSQLIAHGVYGQIIFDRLAARSVVQWLAWSDGAVTWGHTEPPGQPWHPTKEWASHSHSSGGGSKAAPSSPTLPEFPFLVPEPTAVLLLGLLMLGLFSRSHSHKQLIA